MAEVGFGRRKPELMGFLDRLRQARPPTEISLPAIEEEGEYIAQDGTKLWRQGYALVHPRSTQFLAWDAPELQDVGVRVCRVAGVSYRSDNLQRRAFSPGQLLVLRPDPDNPHDPNAVGIWDESGTVQVGWVPRDLAPAVAKKFRRRQPLGGLVLQELRQERGGARVALVIMLCPLGSVRLLLDPEDAADS